jgi:ankyrin repeat protein
MRRYREVMQSLSDPVSRAPGTQAGAALDEDTLRLARQVFQCVRAGDVASLQPLLDRGLPTNLRNENGDSLLMLAAYHGWVDLTRALLVAGADPELANDRGQTPLVGAAFKGFTGIVRVLLDHGANVDGHGPDGRTALMTAAMFNRLDVIEFLLERGARADLRDGGGLTAAEAARRMGADEAAERLAG